MIVPFLLFLCSFAGIAAAVTLPGLTDLILLSAPSAAASLFLFLRAYLDRAKAARKINQKWLIIDGSNVMHWKDGTPQLDTLHEVVQHVKTMGFSAGIVFDANAGHILAGKYLHHDAMGKLLDLPEDRVMVVNKGTPADVTILAAAKDLGARIVTNDRYRDWSQVYPEVQTPGYLIKGGYRAGKLWLALGADQIGPHP